MVKLLRRAVWHKLLKVTNSITCQLNRKCTKEIIATPGTAMKPDTTQRPISGSRGEMNKLV